MVCISCVVCVVCVHGCVSSTEVLLGFLRSHFTKAKPMECLIRGGESGKVRTASLRPEMSRKQKKEKSRNQKKGWMQRKGKENRQRT